MSRQKGRSTNADCRNATNKHQLSNVTDSQMLQDRSTERNKTNKEQDNRENRIKMAREEGAWTTAT